MSRSYWRAHPAAVALAARIAFAGKASNKGTARPESRGALT